LHLFLEPAWSHTARLTIGHWGRRGACSNTKGHTGRGAAKQKNSRPETHEGSKTQCKKGILNSMWTAVAQI
jgi:hypothetical protein